MRSLDGIYINQSHYIENILKKFEEFECKPIKTSSGPCLHLNTNLKDPVSQLRYFQIISTL